jgi:hypothetical protein
MYCSAVRPRTCGEQLIGPQHLHDVAHGAAKHVIPAIALSKPVAAPQHIVVVDCSDGKPRLESSFTPVKRYEEATLIVFALSKRKPDFLRLIKLSSMHLLC